MAAAPWVIPAGLESESTRKRAKVESDSTSAKRLESDSKAVPHDFVPVTEEDLARCLADPMWRLCSGQLYLFGARDGRRICGSFSCT